MIHSSPRLPWPKMDKGNQQPHFMVRRLNLAQRSEAALHCVACKADFPSRGKLLDHAKGVHPETAAQYPDGPLWQSYVAAASNRV